MFIVSKGMMNSMKDTTYGQCRCCLANGNHKNIMKQYFYNGSSEVYHNIFIECFNLYLSNHPSCSSLICDVCIQRLRDAHGFRAMVAATEKLLQSACGDTEFINMGDSLPTQLEVKMEPVKLEEEHVEDDHYISEQEHGAGDSWGDDEPLSALKLSKYEPDMIPGEAELLARYPAPPFPVRERTSLYMLYPDFARQLDNLEGKKITGQMIEKLLEDTEIVCKSRQVRVVYFSEKMGNITNAATLITNSNASPFKSKSRSGFPCFYCRLSFENLKVLQEHQRRHKKSELRLALSAYGVESLVVNVDVTDLKCTICNESMPTWPELKPHLIKKHNKKFINEYADRVIPYKLPVITNDYKYNCQICNATFETYGSIERHMNVHYRNFVCKECGTGFVTKYRLKVHIKSMHIEGIFPCELCKKMFSSQQKLKNHNNAVHKSLKRFKCPKCPERFTEYFRRQRHLVTIHGVAPLTYKCNVCDKAFDRRYTLSRHMKRDHLEERDFQCDICPYKCFTNNELRVHMIKHNGERIHECVVCKKAYARKKTLREHMRIHDNDRRFSCPVCGQAFVQKCSLKGHIKTHHAEYTVQI